MRLKKNLLLCCLLICTSVQAVVIPTTTKIIYHVTLKNESKQSLFYHLYQNDLCTNAPTHLTATDDKTKLSPNHSEDIAITLPNLTTTSEQGCIAIYKPSDEKNDFSLYVGYSVGRNNENALWVDLSRHSAAAISSTKQSINHGVKSTVITIK